MTHLTLTSVEVIVLKEALTDYATKLNFQSKNNPDPAAEEYATAIHLLATLNLIPKEK